MALQNYILMAGFDPTDEQLSSLMKEVSIDVKNRAKMADLKYQEILNLQIKTIFKKYNK